MKKTKVDIEKELVFADDNDEFYFFDKLDSKGKRTLAQNRTLYKILNAISKHLWNPIQEVKIYMLSWCFWTHKIKLSKTEIEVPNISETSSLTKEQWIFFIDTLLAFAKIKNVPVDITPRDIQNLYDSYNNYE